MSDCDIQFGGSIGLSVWFSRAPKTWLVLGTAKQRYRLLRNMRKLSQHMATLEGKSMSCGMKVGGILIKDTTSRPLIRFLERHGKRDTPLIIGFVNHHFVVSCQDLMTEVTDLNGVLLVSDGLGVQIAALLKHGRGFRENMNGTDFVPLLLREARPELTIYLLGGTAEVVEKAATLIQAMPRRRVVGYSDGFSLWTKEADIIHDINAARPDILLVGLGNPRQEKWILKHRRSLDVRMIFAVGALFEWMTGTRRRAPLLVRRARMEWLYRLMLEPNRLAKRYTYDVARFFWIIR